MRQRRLLHILFFFHGKDRTAAFALQSGPGFFRILFPFIPERTREKHFLPVLADSGPQMVKVHGHKIPVLKITAADQCQRGCLHPSERVVAHAGGYPQGDARVHAQYPVRFPACPRRQGEVVEVTVLSQIFETIQDGLFRQGGYPQAQGRFTVTEIVQEIPADQFSFTPRIRGYDQSVGVFEQPAEHFQLPGGYRVGDIPFLSPDLSDNEAEQDRNEGKRLPFHTGGPVSGRRGLCQQVAVSSCDGIPVAVKISFRLFVGAQYGGDAPCHGWLVCKYDSHNFYFYQVNN